MDFEISEQDVGVANDLAADHEALECTDPSIGLASAKAAALAGRARARRVGCYAQLCGSEPAHQRSLGAAIELGKQRLAVELYRQEDCGLCAIELELHLVERPTRP